jgi:hypothetical protein
MSEDRVERLEQSLRATRRHVDELRHNQRHATGTRRDMVLACTLSAAILALTATTWRTVAGAGGVIDVATPWELMSQGWQAAVALTGALAVAIGSAAVFIDNVAGWSTHVVFVVFCVATVVGILLVGQLDPAGSHDPDDVSSSPGRWLTLVAVLVLAFVHGNRAREKLSPGS